ncbi:MAG TPA: hypothetical protein VK208_19720 [Pyrinomonadaceae bacterium]|nr:hypothetical protein [Pyrinomonadaceae bacterium]
MGATFGKTGNLPVLWRFTRSRNKPEDYEKARFIKGVKGNIVNFRYGGKKREIFDDITARRGWLGDLLSRLTREQISDAFRAANNDRGEIEILTDACWIASSNSSVFQGPRAKPIAETLPAAKLCCHVSDRRDDPAFPSHR